VSRHEQDREDLLREATAFPERAELTIPAYPAPIFIGFRPEGALSLYFGQDPVYHFNSTGHLRRAYIAVQLYKADHGRLIALRPERSDRETALLRRELTDDETAALLKQLAAQLISLHEALNAGNYTITGQVPAESAIIPRLRHWLTSYKADITVADQPHVS
jgi:hypothetical protein